MRPRRREIDPPVAPLAHKNKHIRAAVAAAEDAGWTLAKGGTKGHVWGVLRCPERSRAGHTFFVYGTPRNPETHARQILRAVAQCDHPEKRL